MRNSFLQSVEWENFQKNTDKETFRVSNLLFIRMPSSFGKTYLYCPRCDIEEPVLNNLIDNLQDHLKPSDVFIRLEPLSYDLQATSYKLLDCPSVQPKTTLILDLSKSEDDLLVEMKQKTRYNIRLAEKKGVKVEKASEIDLDQIWKLFDETSRRDKFSLHSKEYYQKMLETDMAHLFTAHHENDLLAAMILLIHQDEAVYLHGASSSNKRNLMAPNLMQWQAIKFAKSKECKTYDFWGIQNTEDGGRRTDGVTRFKLGFGGKIVKYPGCSEIPLQGFNYQLFRLFRAVNRILKPRTFQ